MVYGKQRTPHLLYTMFRQYSQFYKPAETEQKPNEVVDVTGWSLGDLSPYQEGARDKALVESPEEIPYKFLVPKHKYLLKKSYTEKSSTVLYWQFWNEIIAYKVGRMLDIPIPPAFVGYYNKKDTEPFYGALIEWFYDYEGNDDIAKRGGDIISTSKYIEGYDTVKGGQHNFLTIKTICEDEKVDSWLELWTNIILLDAVIANTDRHQNNWQLVTYANNQQSYLSPAFDNGTSMGYKVRQKDIAKSMKNLVSYMNKGTHHMKFSLFDGNKAGHVELLQKIVYNFPETENYIKTTLSTDISSIAQSIRELCEFEIYDDRYRLTKERADFIINIIMFRYDWIRKEFKL